MADGADSDELPVPDGRGAKGLAALVLAISLIATLTVWYVVRLQDEHELRHDFEYRVRDLVTRIEQRMLAYEEVLAGVVGLYAASDAVDRREFRTYVERLDLHARYPGVQGIGFAAWLPPAERAAHEAAVRAEGFPDYAIWPAGPRDAYTSIVHLEPFADRNLRAFGYDMYSEPVRRAAMERARDEGVPAISGKVTLVQETETDIQAGFLLYVPVYRPGAAPTTQAARREALQGWVYAPFRVGDLMAGLGGERAAEVDFEIYDGEGTSPETRMFDADRVPRDAPAHDHLLRETRTITVSGRPWTLLVEAHEAFEDRVGSPLPGVVLLVGIGTSVLLSTLALQLAYGRQRALSRAHRTAHDLVRTQARYQKLYAESRVPMIVVDPADGAIVDANLAAEQWYGWPAAELRTKKITEINTLSPEEVRAEMERARQLQKNHFEFRHRLASGAVRDVEVSSGPIDLDGRMLLLSVVLDVTERKRLESELRQLATTDPLTSVANRRAFTARMDEELARARRSPQHRVAILMLDLDHFKRVNDEWGHATGDEVLRRFTALVRNELREVDAIGRLGGEEFGVLLLDADLDAGATLAERLRSRVGATRFEIGGRSIGVTMSVGVTVLRAADPSGERALARADAALYRAKEQGRNRVEREG